MLSWCPRYLKEMTRRAILRWLDLGCKVESLYLTRVANFQWLESISWIWKMKRVILLDACCNSLWTRLVTSHFLEYGISLKSRIAHDSRDQVIGYGSRHSIWLDASRSYLWGIRYHSGRVVKKWVEHQNMIRTMTLTRFSKGWLDPLHPD